MHITVFASLYPWNIAEWNQKMVRYFCLFSWFEQNLWSGAGKIPLAVRAIGNYSTSAALEEPIKPSVTVSLDNTKLLIGGKFVDSASGELFIFLFE